MRFLRLWPFHKLDVMPFHGEMTVSWAVLQELQNEASSFERLFVKMVYAGIPQAMRDEFGDADYLLTAR